MVNPKQKMPYHKYQSKRAKNKKRSMKMPEMTTTEIDPELMRTLQSFSMYPLSTQTQKGLIDAGFTKPTDIQRETIALSLTGCDIVGAAKTGSGKTLAFVVPVLECLWKNKWSRADGVGTVIITPTRELAVQIFQVFNDVGKHHDFSVGVLIGGTDVSFEMNRVSQLNIVIATPGRLLQHMDQNNTFSCDLCQMLIIDEADLILDLGFASQVNSILDNLPRDRQTLLFSATQTRNVSDLARACTKNPTYVNVHEKADNATPDQLIQSYLITKEECKINFLWSFLVTHRSKKILIFVATCKQARFLTETFCTLKPGMSLYGLWGTQNQSRRINMFEDFHAAKSAALIATDVASRGLDFDNVDFVLQLDCPSSVEDYIHRVGRTARMHKKGEAVLILTKSQKVFIDKLEEKNVALHEIHVKANVITDIRIKLSSVLSSRGEYRTFAQAAIVAYAKAIFSMPLRDVFDINTVDVHAVAMSYGLAVAPRLRFLRKRGIDVDRKAVVDAMSGDDGTNDVKRVESAEMNAWNAEDAIDNDDVFKVVRKNIFNVQPDEFELLDEDLKPQSKKKTKTLNKEQLGRKLLKRGALLNVKKIVFDDEGNTVEDTMTVRKFDVAKAESELERRKKEDQMAHKTLLKEIRREKLRKQKARNRKGRGGVDAVDDFADSDDDADSVDISWLPDPDKHSNDSKTQFASESDEEFAPPTAKRFKLPTQESIQSAEEQALALIGMS